MNWPGSKTFSFLVFNNKYKTAQNLNACKCSTNFCDLVKNKNAFQSDAYCPQRPQLDRYPLDRDPPPLDRDPTEIPPGQRLPWTETPLDRDPQNRDPTRQRPPRQRTNWTEIPPRRRTPWTETPQSCDLWCMLGQRPPVNRITVMSALKAYIAMNWPGSKTFSFLVFNDKYKTAQNLNACKCSTNFCDLVKKQECIPVRCILPTETPAGQIPPRQRSSPLGQRPHRDPSWTETPLDRDPPRQRPPKQRPH